MSWLFSRALVAEYSGGSSSDGRQYVASKLTRMGRRHWRHGRTTARSKPSQFGTIYARSTGGPGEALLTWFREASRARTSARPDTDPALTESEAGFGERWHALFVKFDPDTCSWRTHGCLFDEVLPESSVSLPQWGLMRDGVCWELSTSAQTTSESAPGLWPTPTATLGSNGGAITPQKAREGGTLIEAVSNRMWPTPHGFSPDGRTNGPSGNELGRAVNRSLWPTPKSSDHRSGMASRTGGRRSNLNDAAAMFPTPTATNTKANHMRGADKGKPRESRSYRPMDGDRSDDPIGGSLNPTWVCLLMGWPKDWAGLNPISHIQYLQWIMGFSDGQETRTREALRIMRRGHVAEEVSREIGRSVSVHEAALLLAEVCEHANRLDEARVFVACAEALEAEVRGVRIHEGASGTSHQPEHQGQQAREHTDSLQALSRLLAHYGKEAWQSDSWENAVPRVLSGAADRVDQLRALGNGQVPQCMAEAWRRLTA